MMGGLGTVGTALAIDNQWLGLVWRHLADFHCQVRQRQEFAALDVAAAVFLGSPDVDQKRRWCLRQQFLGLGRANSLDRPRLSACLGMTGCVIFEKVKK